MLSGTPPLPVDSQERLVFMAKFNEPHDTIHLFLVQQIDVRALGACPIDCMPSATGKVPKIVSHEGREVKPPAFRI
jgi:hypothetical protein